MGHEDVLDMAFAHALALFLVEEKTYQHSTMW